MIDRVSKVTALLYLVFLVPTVTMAQGGKSPLVYSFAPERDYGPFVYEDTSGEIRGLSIDFLSLLTSKMEVRIKTLSARSLDEILTLARRGEVDLISSLRPTSERSEFLLFTKPYATAEAVLASLPSDDNVSMDGYKGRKVAVGKGYAVETFVRDRFPLVDWVSTDSDLESIHRLSRHEVDAVVADVYSLSFLSDKLGIPLTYGDPVGFEYPLSFAYRRNLPELGPVLDRALRAISQDERRSIYSRWLPQETTQRTDRLQVGATVLAVLSLGVGALIFGISLVRRHAKKRE